jgi:hypothetical protein
MSDIKVALTFRHRRFTAGLGGQGAMTMEKSKIGNFTRHLIRV